MTNSAAQTDAATDTAHIHAGGKFLTFELANEEFALEILRVQEIIGVMDITPVPQTPEFIRGVINLRGRIVPVLDLRSKFDMGTTELTDESCIIVVQTSGTPMGLLADRVREVVNISSEQIDPVPYLASDVDTSCFLGIGKTANGVCLLLDIDAVLTSADAAGLQSIISQPGETEPASQTELVDTLP